MAVLPSNGPGRRRTCTLPVKSRELCRVLSYGAVGCDRQGSNLRRPAFQASALPAELRSREWAEPGSNRRPPPHPRGALPTELSAVDVRLSVQPPVGELDAHAADRALRSRIGTLAISPTKLFTPLTYPSTLDHRPGARRPTWRGVGARCSYGVTVNRHAKVTRTFTRKIQRHIDEDLSLSSGASSAVRPFQAEHHLLVGSS